MNTLVILIISTIVFLVYILLEYAVYVHNFKSIPVRIHLNGTKGKSSVTRLIAAALRETNCEVVTKTTSTLPRLRTDQGIELPVCRLEDNPNIIEQLRIVSFAASNKANILVMECMILNPEIKHHTQDHMIKSTHGIIINTQADHLNVMAAIEQDIRLDIFGSSKLNNMQYLQKTCLDQNSELIVISEQDDNNISDEDMSLFSYMEHKVNVALAIKVCQSLNVSKKTALKGMYKLRADIGATHEYNADLYGTKHVSFIKGFAAHV